MTFSIVTIAILISFGVFGAYNYSRIKLRHKKKYEKFAKGFYKSIKPLLSDNETPVVVLDIVGFLNNAIDDKGVLKGFMSFIGRGKFVERNPIAIENINKIHDFLLARPELKKPYYDALAYAILAMSYNGGLLNGLMFRVWLSGGVTADDETLSGADPRNEVVISRYQQKAHDQLALNGY